MPANQSVGSTTSSTKRGRVATSASAAATQLVVHSTNTTKIFVRRTDGVGGEIRVSHHRKVDPAAPKPLAQPRCPSDAEILQILEPVNERLLQHQPPEAPGWDLLRQWLKEAIDALGTPTSTAPALPAAGSPLHKRTAASTRSLELGSTHGQISPHHNHWRWSALHWQVRMYAADVSTVALLTMTVRAMATTLLR